MFLVCPHLWSGGGVPWPGPDGGGVPSQVPSDLAWGGTRHGGTPLRPGWMYPYWGVPHLRYPCQTWLGVPLLGGTPPWVPQSELAGEGYPSQVQPGGTPPWVTPPSTGGTPPQVPLSDLAGGTPAGGYPTLGTPVRAGWGGVPQPGPARGYPTLGNPPSDLAWGYPSWGTLPRVPPSELAGGYHTSGTSHQTWLGRGMPARSSQGVPHLG